MKDITRAVSTAQIEHRTVGLTITPITRPAVTVLHELQGGNEASGECRSVDLDRDGTFRPSGFYFRRDLRRADSIERAVAIGMDLVNEIERLQAWIEDQGLRAPMFVASPDEAREKGWMSPSPARQSVN